VTAFLDTHEVVKELKAAGFTDEQAEAVTRAVRRGQDIDLSNLATKSDIEALRLATKSDIEALRSATKSDVASLKSDIEALRSSTKSDLQAGLAETRAEILKWMVGTIGLQTVVILGAVVALARLLH
jgi:hypothetical protein